jgi:hypothetical protein
MSFQFATCERNRALGFLKKLYPNQNIQDTSESASPLLDFVEADVVRITDPDFHQGEVVPGTHWDESKRDAVVAACLLFHK